jgi:hypothetical protein
MMTKKCQKMPKKNLILNAVKNNIGNLKMLISVTIFLRKRFSVSFLCFLYGNDMETKKNLKKLKNIRCEK